MLKFDIPPALPLAYLSIIIFVLGVVIYTKYNNSPVSVYIFFLVLHFGLLIYYWRQPSSQKNRSNRIISLQ